MPWPASTGRESGPVNYEMLSWAADLTHRCHVLLYDDFRAGVAHLVGADGGRVGTEVQVRQSCLEECWIANSEVLPQKLSA